MDAYRASYGVENALYAVTQLAQVGGRVGRRGDASPRGKEGEGGVVPPPTRPAPLPPSTHQSSIPPSHPPTPQTTMRSELGKISLDSVFSERDTLNANIVASIQSAAQVWGLQVLR